MKILLICSKSFYDRLLDYKQALEDLGHEVELPNYWYAPETEAKYRGTPDHRVFKANMFKRSEETIKNMHAVLV